MEYQRPKSASKVVLAKGPKLTEKILSTMNLAAELVGATLGPGGQPVLIERFDEERTPIVTKDGVTVMKSLGLTDSTSQTILEAARDAATRTATEAGDGCEPLWAKILTPNGWSTMGEMKVGTDICGTNGTIQKVLGVYTKGEKEIIKMTFDHGQVVECCEDHLWTVTTANNEVKTLPVKELIKDFKSVSKTGYNQYKYYTPYPNIINFKENPNLPLDPYLVGLLIGDGCLRDSGSVELSLGLKKKHVLDKIRLPNGISFKAVWVERKHYFRVKITGVNYKGESIRDLLEKVGLKNTNSHTKFIPDCYLINSQENRAALLQGLLDTDGWFNVKNNRFQFSTVSEQLAHDFVFLCRSLGILVKSRLKIRKEGGSYSMNPIYEIVQRKGYKYGTKIVNMERTSKYTQVQCIKVSNPDNLYITDDFIVTHNTSTSTVLANAIVKNIHEFCTKNPKISPQKVVRKLETTWQNVLQPAIRSWAYSTKEKPELLESVAKISTNNDQGLAKVVMQCFEQVGDEGNVTIIEQSGPSGYKVELLDGYPITVGYEDSCGAMAAAFINEQSKQKVVYQNPVFLLHYGQITDVNQVIDILSKVGDELEKRKRNPPESDYKSYCVVVCATGFSERVISTFAYSSQQPGNIKVFPLKVPLSPLTNGQKQFLDDLAAVTGATVFDPLSKPMDTGTLLDLGPSVPSFECGRYKSAIIGRAEGEDENGELYEDRLLHRVEDLEVLAANPESKLDQILLQERIGKLTGGIAKLIVIGSSAGELKEKADRAEDAVCAVKGAIKHGCLPGGGWTLLKLTSILSDDDPVIKEILQPSLMAPVLKMLGNCGFNNEDIHQILSPIFDSMDTDSPVIYDAYEQKHGDPVALGVLDSVPAVEEAIKNALSIATLLGTLGGTVVFQRDDDFDKKQANEIKDFIRNSNINEADQRG